MTESFEAYRDRVMSNARMELGLMTSSPLATMRLTGLTEPVPAGKAAITPEAWTIDTLPVLRTFTTSRGGRVQRWSWAGFDFRCRRDALAYRREATSGGLATVFVYRARLVKRDRGFHR